MRIGKGQRNIVGIFSSAEAAARAHDSAAFYLHGRWVISLVKVVIRMCFVKYVKEFIMLLVCNSSKVPLITFYHHFIVFCCNPIHSKAKLNFKDEIPPPPDEAILLRIQGVHPPHPRHLKTTESERRASGAFRGVTQRKSGRYKAQISYKGINLCLETYSTPEAAARARDSAYYYLHGRWVGQSNSMAGVTKLTTL